MNPNTLKNICTISISVTLLTALTIGGQLSRRTKEVSDLKTDLQQVNQDIADHKNIIATIKKKNIAKQTDFNQNIVSTDQPILWCLEHIREIIGLDDVNIECIGPKPPSGMTINRTARNTMESHMACLSPYSVRLAFGDITPARLQYVLEQIETPETSAIIQNLDLSPSEKTGHFDVTAILHLPQFQLPEDRKLIYHFLGLERMPWDRNSEVPENVQAP